MRVLSVLWSDPGKRGSSDAEIRILVPDRALHQPSGLLGLKGLERRRQVTLHPEETHG